MRSKEALQIRILNLCDENELSLNALGARCGITQSTLNNIVNGRNNSITIHHYHSDRSEDMPGTGHGAAGVL